MTFPDDASPCRTRLCRIVIRAGRLARRYVFPFLLVLPVVCYAYVIQAVVVSQTRHHERALVQEKLQMVSSRLSALIKQQTTTCRDYAHWDDTYENALVPNPDWLRSNFDLALGVSFGYGIVLFQHRAGNEIWSKGLTDGIRREMKARRVLERCLASGKVSGVFRLGRKLWIGSAVDVRNSSHTGTPRGMIFVALLLSPEVLRALEPGPNQRMRLYEGLPAASSDRTGESATLERLARRAVAEGRSVHEGSRDWGSYYSALPLKDITGRSVGAITMVSSRRNVRSMVRAIQQMVFVFAVLCAGVGFAGVSYLRYRELAQLAHRDQLTGLYNHGHIQQSFRNQLQIAERYGRPLSLMMFDVDHFKVFNDTNGHVVGDRVLEFIAEVAREFVRETDTLARYGGEEFLVVMPETDRTQALAAAERLRLAIEDGFVHAREPGRGGTGFVTLKVTASFGIASFPEDGRTPGELLASVDAALALAKRTRNTVAAFGGTTADELEGSLIGGPLDGFLRDSSISSVRPLIAAIDHRSSDTARHSERTAEYAVAIGREMGFSTSDLALTVKAALLHDVGMVSVPDYLLVKKPPLTDEEVELLKRHVELGIDVLAQSPQLANVAEIVRCHHEHFDGRGYPAGISGEEIPIISRVIAVADVLDALTNERPYRHALSWSDAAEELRRNASTQFDPRVVEAAVRVIDRLQRYDKTDERAA